MGIKVFVLEDESSIRSFIRIKLRSLGYQVLEADCGEDALEKLDETVDIALLDVMLPDIDGFEVCSILRQKYPQLGIIMLTAKGVEQDKIMGLGSGADDYMVKPFSPKELIARMESLLRRLRINERLEKKEDRITINPFAIDRGKKIVYKNDDPIQLTPTEYAIFNYLIDNRDRAIGRDELLDSIWGEDYFGDMKTVDVNVRRIRQKVEEDPSKPLYLKTVWGHGYIWSDKE